jgi:hypothetical protein
VSFEGTESGARDRTDRAVRRARWNELRRPGGLETGVYGASGPSSALGVAEITFVPKLAAAPTASEYAAGAGTATCPGPGQASAGRLCVYQGFINGMTLDNICSPVQACGGSPTALGAEVYFITSSGAANTVGTWVYKAP